MIINLTRNPSGAYVPPQTWGDDHIPDGFATVPDTLDFSAFYQYGGFATLTVEDGVVTGMTPDTAKWAAWQEAVAVYEKAHPKPAPVQTPYEKTALALAELAETQQSQDTENKLALAELAEAMTGGSNG